MEDEKGPTGIAALEEEVQRPVADDYDIAMTREALSDLERMNEQNGSLDDLANTGSMNPRLQMHEQAVAQMERENTGFIQYLINMVYKILGKEVPTVLDRDVRRIDAMETVVQKELKYSEMGVGEQVALLSKKKERMIYLDSRLPEVKGMIGAYEAKIAEVTAEIKGLGSATDEKLDELKAEYAKNLVNNARLPEAQQKAKLLHAMSSYISTLEEKKGLQEIKYVDLGLELNDLSQEAVELEKEIGVDRNQLAVSKGILAKNRSRKRKIQNVAKRQRRSTDLVGSISAYVGATSEAGAHTGVVHAYASEVQADMMNRIVEADNAENPVDNLSPGHRADAYEAAGIMQSIDEGITRTKEYLFK